MVALRPSPPDAKVEPATTSEADHPGQKGFLQSPPSGVFVSEGRAFCWRPTPSSQPALATPSTTEGQPWHQCKHCLLRRRMECGDCGDCPLCCSCPGCKPGVGAARFKPHTPWACSIGSAFFVAYPQGPSQDTESATPPHSSVGPQGHMTAPTAVADATGVGKAKSSTLEEGAAALSRKELKPAAQHSNRR